MNRLLALSILSLALSACGSWGTKHSGGYAMDQDRPPAKSEIPADIARTPDAVPKNEPIAKSGNPDYYEVLGESYSVQKQRDSGFHERGKASWYAKKFHGHKTASGETYDMFGMTAAHKTLPLPSYVRVTRTDNGKNCIVRVNDRGPFVSGRIIDLSYAAAARLGMIVDGEAPVQIEVVSAGDEVAPPQNVAAAPEPARWQPGYWIVGNFEDPIDAAAVREDLRSAGVAQVDVQNVADSGKALLRVVAGPYADENESVAAREKIRMRGLDPQWRVN